MRRSLLILAGLTLLATSCQPSPPAGAEPPDFTARDFQHLLQTLGDGWNGGDARKAADCFTEDAVYTQPPDSQVYQGRDALFTFFGGEDGRPGAMQMTWHHIAFNENSGIGMGEFTFTYGTSAHGVAVVKIEDGLIARWREYWVGSELSWEAFVGINPF